MVRNRIWSWYSILLTFILFAAVVLIILQNTIITGNAVEKIPSITGHASQGTTSSNVSIIYFASMALCGNLFTGISFGEVANLPADNVNEIGRAHV